MGKIVLRKTLAVESFVKSLVERGVLEVKEIVDFQHQKLNPQLLQDLMMFVEEEITTSKYKKEQINRTELVKTILCQVFEFKDEEIDLSCENAVVIGAGNVAMDVARMLALEPSELDPTDTADHVIDAFKGSAIRNVVISARRGPEHAAFTSPELRELPKLEHTNVLMAKSDIEAAIARVGEEIEKDTKSNLDAMFLISEKEATNHDRTMKFQFLATPVEFKGAGKVEEVVFQKTGSDENLREGPSVLC
jgi:NADPH-dependent glutamate synthase beta subunit-like oxidoreductase